MDQELINKSMKPLRLESKHFKDTDNYWKEYIGREDVSDYDGNIEIAGKLGYVKFKSIKVSGYLVAEGCSGIEAGEDIKAGSSIEAGSGIKAGWGIEAGWGIKAG